MINLAGIFWLSLGTILYTYFGYPFLLTLLVRFLRRPHIKAPFFPSVTLVIAAHNEASIIDDKIKNSLALDYPRECLRLLVVEDGSDDNTVDIVYGYKDIMVHHQPFRLGKAEAIRQVVPSIDSEIIVFSDANAMLNPDSIQALTRHFADPSVGGVAGEKQVLGGGEGLYWRYESYLKKRESQLSSVMGATGEIFAIRRSAFEPPPSDAIIEDFMMSMRLVARGWRVVYEPEAIAQEAPLDSMQGDWQRRTRIAAGGMQSIGRLREMLKLKQGLVAWQYLSHRLLRWAVIPWLLPVTLLTNVMLWPRSFYRLLLTAQLLFYGLGFVGFLQARGTLPEVSRGVGKIFSTVFFFCLANLAAIVGFWRHLTGKQSSSWKKVR